MNRRAARPRLISRSSSLTRQVGTKTVKKTVIVVCEGTKTEPQYIEALADDIRVRQISSVSLRVEAADKGDVPLTLVRRAVEIKKRAKKESGEVDEIWCVFDVEWPRNHPNLSEALRLADRNGIDVAVSNPCFEIWLTLHFRDATGFLDNDQARRLRRACDGQEGKRLDPSIYAPLRDQAVTRAHKLEEKHAADGTKFAHDNPSSGMHRLVRSVTPLDKSESL